MASRDLTSAFVERRGAANRRRRSSGVPTSKMVPFGRFKRVNFMFNGHRVLYFERHIYNNSFVVDLRICRTSGRGKSPASIVWGTDVEDGAFW